MNTFHGSYAPVDVTFLLKRIFMEPVDVAEKEALIQSGKRHYSSMISVERPPDAEYLQLFYQALEDNKERMAVDVAFLAKSLCEKHRQSSEIVLVSLARAGTPIGALLNRVLHYQGKRSHHYSISIIRDKGIDRAALDYIRARHSESNVEFVDGWIAKGAIAGELQKSVGEYNAENNANFNTQLVAVADLCGLAGLAATSDDYLIPSSILNAIISGLVSRTILNDEYCAPGEFHGCMFYEELSPHDLSQYFLGIMTPLVVKALRRDLRPGEERALNWSVSGRASLGEHSRKFVCDLMTEFNLKDKNRIKPGIGESTRALLRRMPRLLIVNSLNSRNTEHLIVLARQRQVEVLVRPHLGYEAAVIISSLGMD